MISLREFVALRDQVNALMALVQGIAAQQDRLQAQLNEQQEKRGPGRPPKEHANR